MKNSELKRGQLVRKGGKPFVVSRTDGGQMALVFPGDTLPAREAGSDAGHWTFSETLRPRERAGDATLEAVVAAIRNRMAYAKEVHGETSARYQALLDLGFDLADRLYGEEGPERTEFLHRLFM